METEPFEALSAPPDSKESFAKGARNLEKASRPAARNFKQEELTEKEHLDANMDRKLRLLEVQDWLSRLKDAADIRIELHDHTKDRIPTAANERYDFYYKGKLIGSPAYPHRLEKEEFLETVNYAVNDYLNHDDERSTQEIDADKKRLRDINTWIAESKELKGVTIKLHDRRKDRIPMAAPEQYDIYYNGKLIASPGYPYKLPKEEFLETVQNWVKPESKKKNETLKKR